MQLVELAQVCPDVVIDLRYAQSDNIAGRELYSADFSAQLEVPAAKALQRAASQVGHAGYQLVIWDAYRPPEVQAQLLKISPALTDKYVLTESNHCKGLAVDVTLATSQGTVLDMGTYHDDFTERAHIAAVDLTPEQQSNRQVLITAMHDAGFKVWPYEWWHFDFTG